MSLADQMSTLKQPSSSPQPEDGKLIYVVDDESMIGDVVQIVRRLEGFHSRFFDHPEKAWRALQEEPVKPVLLLTDYVMTPINGLQLIQRCKAQFPEIKTILYSGNATEDILIHAPVQPDAFLRKPFLPRALVNLIRSTLSVP